VRPWERFAQSRSRPVCSPDHLRPPRLTTPTFLGFPRADRARSHLSGGPGRPAYQGVGGKGTGPPILPRMGPIIRQEWIGEIDPEIVGEYFEVGSGIVERSQERLSVPLPYWSKSQSSQSRRPNREGSLLRSPTSPHGQVACAPPGRPRTAIATADTRRPYDHELARG
jgi:hypothetical protein